MAVNKYLQPKTLDTLKLPKVLIFSFCALLLLFYGCSTTNHPTLPAASYQEITSHYNAYFNVHEKLKGIYKLSEQYHKDKFDSVIPVYHYNDSKEFASYASDLDDVIKRSTLAIQIHTTSSWTDDHFLMVGQANYLKGDYDKASGSFKYITTEFKEGVDYVKVMRSLGKKPGKYVRVKKKNIKAEVKVTTNKDGTKSLEKVDKRPEVSLWIHTPARSQALVWLIKTYTRQKKYEQATSVVAYVRGDDMFYKNFEPELDLAEADLKVSKKDYAGAIQPLEKYLDAPKIKNKKHLIVRPLFVLAQCYQRTGNSSKAIENYAKVLKSHPSTEMEFYAKLKMAKLASGGAGNSGIKQLLARMARDFRYRDYRDQVFYELAMLSLNENNRNEGRDFLHKSVKSSVGNDEQKAMSFLKLAELDYEDEAYVPSKFFYDSTLHFMAKNDVRYHNIDDRDKVLSNLVKQLNIIADEDSLQKMASMSKGEQDKAIADAIARREKEAEDKKKAIEEAKQQNKNLLTNNQQGGGQNQQSQASSWYFYNTTTRASGYNEFITKWGKRNLEEDWRRKNKSSVTVDSSADVNPLADTTSKKESTSQTKGGSVEEQMRASIPTTPEKLAKSVDRIVDAYYMAGTIYKDGLQAYGKAQTMFETLNSRFPKHKLLLESYYNLYLIAMHEKMNDKAENYKNLILSEFPESVIAKVLKDPSYINQAKNKEKALDDYFAKTFSFYETSHLDSAWYRCEMSDVVFKPNPFSAKFQLLEALILAKQNRLSDYVQALNLLIAKTTDVQVKKTATDLLNLLNKSTLPQVDLSKDTLRRDSLNTVFAIKSAPSINAAQPDSAELQLIKLMEAAKEKAKKEGKFVDTAKVQNTIASKDTKVAADNSAGSKDTTSKAAPNNAPDIVQEDTTSPYRRGDGAVHYFIVYIKDPAVSAGVMSELIAKINASNLGQFAAKRLQTKQTVIDSKNKLVVVRQFKSKDDVMAYFNLIKTQTTLFSDLKPEQYAISAISTGNFSTLLDLKDIDQYNKFFNRVYNK